MRPRVLVDSDGVVCDLESTWLRWYQLNHEPDMTAEKMFRAWHVDKHVGAGEAVYDAFSSPSFFLSLKPYPDQLMWLEKLNQVADVVITTDCRGVPQAGYDKMMWYRFNAPFLDLSKQITLTGEKWMIKADAMVDDKLSNITKFKEQQSVCARYDGSSCMGFYVRRSHGAEDVVDNLRIREVSGLQQVYEFYK